MSNPLEEAIVQWTTDQQKLRQLLRETKNVSYPTSRRSGSRIVHEELERGGSSSISSSSSSSSSASGKRRIIIDDNGEHTEEVGKRQRTGQQQHQQEGEQQQQPIGLSVGKLRYDIPGLSRNDPYPLQLPDGRRYPGDTERWSEEYMDIEDAKRRLVEKDPNNKFLTIVAGLIADDYPTRELYEFRDTAALGRQRLARERQQDLADRVRVAQLERALKQQPQTAELQTALERLEARTEELSQRYRAIPEQTLELQKAKLEQKAIRAFVTFVDLWQRVYPPILQLLQQQRSGEISIDVRQYNEIRQQMGLQAWGEDVSQSIDRRELEAAHRLDLKDWFGIHPIAGPLVAEAFSAWAATLEEPGALLDSSILKFNDAFGKGAGGRARASLVQRANDLTPEIAAIDERERERGAIFREMTESHDQLQQVARELQLMLGRRDRMQREIEELLTRRTTEFDEPNVEWIDRPENSGKIELRPKVSSALHKAYAMACQQMKDSSYDWPSMEDFTERAHLSVMMPFADLIYHYYWLDGLPKRYRGNKEKEDMKAEILHLLEFFESHAFKDGNGVLRSQRSPGAYYGRLDGAPVPAESVYRYSQPLGFQPVF